MEVVGCPLRRVQAEVVPSKMRTFFERAICEKRRSPFFMAARSRAMRLDKEGVVRNSQLGYVLDLELTTHKK